MNKTSVPWLITRARTWRGHELRIECAVAANSADIGQALVEGGKSAVLTISTLRVTGAPRIVLGIGMRVDPRDADENRGHEEECLHGRLLRWGLLRIETTDPVKRKPAPCESGFTFLLVSILWNAEEAGAAAQRGKHSPKHDSRDYCFTTRAVLNSRNPRLVALHSAYPERMPAMRKGRRSVDHIIQRRMSSRRVRVIAKAQGTTAAAVSAAIDRRAASMVRCQNARTSAS